MPITKPCAAPGCDRLSHNGRLCSAHVYRKSAGLSLDPISTPSLSERFWSKVNKDGPTMPHMETPCWVWGNLPDDKGYSRISVNRRNRPAHRVSYELNVGPVPDGLDLDHLCRNRACTNFLHLEPVTRAENTRRGLALLPLGPRKTHCKAGHAMTPENSKTSNGAVTCRTCRRAYIRAYRAARAERRIGARVVLLRDGREVTE